MDRDKALLKIIRQKSDGTITLFNKQDSYKCYGDNAILVANEILMSDVGIQMLEIANSENIPCLNLNNAQYLRVVRDLLLLLRYRVEVYDESPGGVFQLKAKGTLGNLTDFEDILSECVELTEHSTIMCARLIGDDDSENRISLTFCNSQDLRVIVSELTDTSHFTLFEQCIVSLLPRECLLFQKDSFRSPNRFKKLELAIQRTNMQKVIAEEFVEKVEDCRVKVLSLLRTKNEPSFGDFTWQGLATLFKHMQLLNDPQYKNSFTLLDYNMVGYLYLSNAALQALEIFAVGSDTDVGPTSVSATLYDHMNKCRSQPGRKILREWMRRPLFSQRQIVERLNVVEALVEGHSVRQTLYENFLRLVPDIPLFTRKLILGKAKLQDCYRLFQLCKLLEKFENTVVQLQDEVSETIWWSIKELILEPIQHSILEFKQFISLIENTLDMEYLEQHRQYRIKPDIDESLLEMDQQIRKLEAQANNELDKICSRLNCDSMKLESDKDGYFFRATSKSENSIRKDHDMHIMPGGVTKGGGVQFRSGALKHINENFKDIHEAYDQGQTELTNAVLKTCAGYAPAFQTLTERIGILDVLTSFAVLAASSPTPYVRPDILEKGTNVFELEGCRHPVVENLSNVEYIPNDVLLGDADNSKFVVLTGANMGGKSTYLRSAALTVLMAQIGSFVPCTSARFSMIDGIYTRVGAGDFQCKGVSTFMAEMVDSATILERATKNSLIVIDELGRGTSTYDGFGLAWAIAEDIITRIGCFCVFATHFHELGRLKEKYTEEVKNCKMDTLVEDGRVTVLYQVVPGVADRSFGLNIAQLVGFSKEIIEDAAHILEQLESGMKRQEVRIG